MTHGYCRRIYFWYTFAFPFTVFQCDLMKEIPNLLFCLNQNCTHQYDYYRSLVFLVCSILYQWNGQRLALILFYRLLYSHHFIHICISTFHIYSISFLLNFVAPFLLIHPTCCSKYLIILGSSGFLFFLWALSFCASFFEISLFIRSLLFYTYVYIRLLFYEAATWKMWLTNTQTHTQRVFWIIWGLWRTNAQ